MNLSGAPAVLSALHVPGAYGGNPPDWEEAMAALPEATLPFLDKATLPGRVDAAGLLQDHVAPLAEVLDLVAADANLRTLAWFLHWRTFLVPEKGVLWGAPPLLDRLGSRAGLFYMLLALEFPPRLHAYHGKLGYPREVTEETLRQLSCYESNHLRGRGTQGIYERQFPWLSSYLFQPFVRLGRLEYQLQPYRGGVVVWKRTTDGAVIALAENGARVDTAGLLAEASDGSAWTAALEEDAAAVTGHPVDPAGAILKAKVHLPRPAWQPYLHAGDPVLNLHIPSGGGMDWDAVVASFRRALDFFRRHHPDGPWKTLVVGTWFMDPRLRGLLPADANPLRFQRAVHLYPTPPQPDSLWFVFLRPVSGAPVSSLPRETSLQRSLIRFLEGGGTWHGGGFFLLPEDMADPAPDGYRRRFRELARELGIA